MRTAKSDLLRVVVVEGRVVPDPRGRLPGRGAWLHPTPGCLDLAERRRAFPRAFRLAGPLDLSALRRHVEEPVVAEPAEPSAVPVESEAGRDCDERSMSTQR